MGQAASAEGRPSPDPAAVEEGAVSLPLAKQSTKNKMPAPLKQDTDDRMPGTSGVSQPAARKMPGTSGDSQPATRKLQDWLTTPNKMPQRSDRSSEAAMIALADERSAGEAAITVPVASVATDTAPVRLELEAQQIPNYTAKCDRVARGAPHQWLATCRLSMALQNEVARDLTHDDNVLWRFWICQMPQAQAREVIGTGVVKFEGRFLRSREPNHRHLAEAGVPERLVQFRFDFVAHRVDGTAVRFHPGSRADAAITYGCLRDWGSPDVESRVPTPGTRSQPMPPRTRREPFKNFNETDIFSNAAVRRWIEKRKQAHGEADFQENVLEGDLFPWQRFLMGRPWGKKLLLEGVTTMTLVRWERQPAFRFTTLAWPEERHIRVSGKRSQIVV